MVQQVDIDRLDPQGMLGHIKSFAAQLRQGVDIGKHIDFQSRLPRSLKQIILAGMGGSAIAGDLLQSFLGEKLQVPLVVHRDYGLPPQAQDGSLVICSSYSGATEETLSAFVQAIDLKLPVICLSSGGRLAELARAHSCPLIIIPSGLPPRAALGYLFAPLLVIFGRLGFCADHTAILLKAADWVEKLSIEYSPERGHNPALELANNLAGRVICVYSGRGLGYAAGLRFKCQICENAKQLVFFNVSPEFNHNELVGWEKLVRPANEYTAVFFNDADDHPRVKLRQGVIYAWLKDKGVPVHEVSGLGSERLARLLSMVHFGDFVSYYLAILNGVDPTPVDVIAYVKSRLAQET